jgi:hypothetical protein
MRPGAVRNAIRFASIVALCLVAANALAATPPVSLLPANKDLPEHAKVCTAEAKSRQGVVSREKLANYLLNLHPLSANLLMNEAVSIAASNPAYRDATPAERAKILPRLLLALPLCPTGDKSCSDSDAKAASGIRRSFHDFLEEGTAQGAYSYSGDTSITVSDYYAANNHSQIVCSAEVDVTPSKEPGSTTDNNPIRVRGAADDLYIDRNSTDAFKSTSSATANVTSDSSTTKSQTTKLTAVVGYDIPIQGANSFGDLIPYLSANQSVTDTFHKPRNKDANNNWAAGIADVTQVQVGDVVHYFTIKPQYLTNTTQRSQVAEGRFIYAPWTDSGIFLNTPFGIPISPIDLRGQILFDLRSDIGTFTDKGDPAFAHSNKGFGRAGTKSGFSLTTPAPNQTSITLVATETLMYGWAGSLRNLDLFQSSLTWNLDPNSYFGVKASYQNGFDEDTNVRVQTWTIGLSGHY